MSFGPPPHTLRTADYSWLATGRPKRVDLPKPKPTRADITPVARGYLPPEPQRQPQRKRASHQTPDPPMEWAEPPRRAEGLCGDRHLPLHRHAPRPRPASASLADGKTVRPWQPQADWRPAAKSSAASSGPAVRTPASVALSGPSARVLRECARQLPRPDVLVRGNGREGVMQSRPGGSAWCPPVSPKEAPPPPPESERMPPSSFAFDEECGAWGLRGASKSLGPDAPLDIINSFLGGEVAADFLTPAVGEILPQHASALSAFPGLALGEGQRLSIVPSTLFGPEAAGEPEAFARDYGHYPRVVTDSGNLNAYVQ